MRKRQFISLLLLGVFVMDALLIFGPPNSNLSVNTIFQHTELRDINTGLISHYEFNNGSGNILYDHGTNGFDGDFVGNPIWVLGRWSKSLEFGGGDYVDISDVAKYIGKNHVKNITLTAWVNYTTAGEMEIIGSADANVFAELQVESNGTVHFLMEDSDDKDYMVWSSSSLNDGKWHFVVGQYNYTSKKMQIWIDGSLNQERTYSFEPVNEPVTYYIAHGDDGDFQGRIDDVRVYSRTLNPEEIAFLYNYSDLHDPISISGDAGFASFAQSEHIAGNGSAANTYEISGYYIVSTTSYPFSIHNTRAHFVIDQCYVQSGSRGVYLSSVENATISSNIIEKCGDGMSGIYVTNTMKNSVIVDNVIRNNTGYGLYVDTSIYNITIGNNSFFNDSMFFYGYYLENINITGNTVNGKPIYFYHDVDGNNLTVPSDAGEVIFVNASHIIVDGASFAMEEVSIEILSSDNITVRNTTFSDIQWHSIYTYGNIREVKDVLIENVNSVNSSVPLEVYYWTSNIYLRNSTFTGYAYIGIDEYGSVNRVVVENNTFRDISNGYNNLIYIGGGNHITVKNNTFENITTKDYAVIYADDDVEGVYNLRVENNTIENFNAECAMDMVSNDYNTIVTNNTIENANTTYGAIYTYTVKQLIGNTVKNVSGTGISVKGSNADISENYILNASGEGLYVKGSGNMIHNNTVILSGAYGIHMDSGSSNNLIYGNYLIRNNGSSDTYSSGHVQAKDDGTNNRWNDTIGNYWYDLVWPDENWDNIVDVPYNLDGGVDHYPIARAPHGPIIINNDSDLMAWAERDFWPGDGSEANPYIISGYEINATGNVGIYIGNVTLNFTIKHTEIYDVNSGGFYGGAAIMLYSTGHGLVKENYLHNFNYGIYLYSTSGNRISGNIINGSLTGNCGMYLKYANRGRIDNNTVYNLGSSGIYSYGGGHIVMENNTVWDNGGYGILLSNSQSDVVKYNTITRNSRDGVRMENYLDLGWILHNNIPWNGEFGVSVGVYADSITIAYNYIANNTEYGVFLSGMSNTIYNNSFYFNNGSNGTYNESHVQAYDEGGHNQWNTTTTGNYWYDWANNNDTNDQDPHDGFVDWPYKLDGSVGAMDKLPIANPQPAVPELTWYLTIIMAAIIIIARKRR